MTNRPNEIILDHECKRYGSTSVIENLNMEVRAGERLVLLGPSGCGKSTTLRMLAGLEEISEGELRMGGQRMNEVPSGKRNIAMVFQNYALYPHMSVKDNITYALRIHKTDKKELQERLDMALDILRLKKYADRKPRELSGGQRQRVALARGIVKKSPYLLLDEPLSNLDALLRVQARKELVNIHNHFHQTFIYVTHDQVEAMTVGQRIALLNNGELQMMDTPSRVYHRPANVFCAKFIGSPSTNVTDVDYRDGVVSIGSQTLQLPDYWIRQIQKVHHDSLVLGLRPEHIVLSKETTEHSVRGTLRYVEDLGNKLCAYLMVEGQEVVCLCDRLPVSIGETVHLHVDFTRIHLFDGSTEASIGYPAEIGEVDETPGVVSIA